MTAEDRLELYPLHPHSGNAGSKSLVNSYYQLTGETPVLQPTTHYQAAAFPPDFYKKVALYAAQKGEFF